MRVGEMDETWIDSAVQAYELFTCGRTATMPHAQTTLAELRGQGYKLGLISNTMFSGRAHISDLEKFGMRDYFDVMLFSGDVNLWKPRAETFHHVLDQLGVTPEQAVFVGDDPASDVVGGRNAGMWTVHYHANDRFPTPKGVEPHAQIQALSELLAVVRQWGNSRG